MLQVGQRGLSYDEFVTILAEASAIVNQTPLWRMSDHPDDPAPLTPAMLLTLREDSDVIREQFSDKDLLQYGKQRYRRAQYLAQQFWVRWRNEYLHTLTQRHKWKARKSCITVGDVVLIRDKQAARNHWPLGRVSDVRRSKDGLVRSVTVRTASRSADSVKFYDRPISELVLLVPSDTHKC